MTDLALKGDNEIVDAMRLCVRLIRRGDGITPRMKREVLRAGYSNTIQLADTLDKIVKYWDETTRDYMMPCLYVQLMKDFPPINKEKQAEKE